MMSDRKKNPSSDHATEALLNFARPQRILMVADGSLDFGNGHYGLGELVSLLQVEGHNVSTAHRYGLGDNSIEGVFHFAQCSKAINLANYDQVWLFGFSATPLQESERRAVASFMDEGGGVFATGGHGLLGSGMGANLPRIRAMRRWSASPVFDESSLDIILKRAPDASYLSQQDAADPAEKIAPVFLTNGGDQFLMASWYPHPILRHKTGVIESLPCHSLATECLEPAAKAGSFFAGIEEWPADSSKPQSRPRVNIIAKSMSGTQQWGSISVYDGDSADVGRIVCDSSWRRFINLNITKTHPKLHQYFLNIVAWLTPKSKRDPWNRILCALAHAELNNLNARDIELEQIDWEPLIRAGTLVEEQLTRQHGPGATEELINELLRIAGASSSLKQLFSLRTSLEILKQRETLPNTLLVPRHLVRRAILGATAHSLLKTASLDYLPGTLMHTAEAQERLMRLTVKSGVRFAEQAIANFLNGALKSTRDFVQQVSPHPHEHTLSSEPVTLD